MDFKTYAKSRQTEVCLELERVKLLLSKAGNPHRGMYIIHVAGTNGKGSVCAYVCAGLDAMKKRWGRFSSPELFSVEDTICVENEFITSRELEKIYEFLRPLSKEVENETGKNVSQFEINFVASLLHFKNKGCTHICLECGMGGIGDATNSIDDSDICVITKISKDHMNYLGNTIEEICENKCGIFKESSCVITGFQQERIKEKIALLAKDREFIYADKLRSEGFEGFSEIVSFSDEKDVKLSLSGTGQIQNASIAYEVLKKIGADKKQIRYALENAKNPARFEKIGENVYFDGAHNPDGVEALKNSLNRYLENEKIIFVVGFMKDKEYKEALSKLRELKQKDISFIAVPVKTNPRSASSEDLKIAIESLGFECETSESVSDAIEYAKKRADFVFVIGSLYMYKEL